MKAIETSLPGVFILEPKIFGDARGWFMESWSTEKMLSAGFDFNFVQDNHSFSTQKGVLRGIHFQNNPYAQTKLVRCTKGAILDVVVDLRKNSPTYKQWLSVELSAENYKQLLIPRGFGHGFLTLTDNVEFMYKVDNLYNAAADRSIRWHDPELAVNWGVERPTVSEKDANAPLLNNSDCNFE
ncbi:MAG: dTDP-4-dehydrorhamnose 3,5-epimerase [Clostridiales bacterium]|jgi:dTDP-4-dehydrorhamnose 3,5-epimerase|nr:dTDP-4-dehydrorhamnose 3,5-epimerase [Clostridiales bacterium]